MPWLVQLLLAIAASTAHAGDDKPTSTTPQPCHCPTWHHHYKHKHGPSRYGLSFVSSTSTLKSTAGERVRDGANSGRRTLNQLRRQISGDVAVDESALVDVEAVPGDDDNVDRWLRFAGVGRLYANKDKNLTAEAVLDRLTSATVAVVGLGGVGSWAAESLCRSGVGHLVLVDLDDICISNTNRQLHATDAAVGKMKIDEMKNRLLDINPRCQVTCIHDFVTVDNANALIQKLGPLTSCIDAIDGMHEKTALILACVDLGIPIVTCGGAAGRLDPTRIVVDDLTKAQEDRLLFQCRKLLRQKHGFPKVKGTHTRVRRWRLPAVFSTEVVPPRATSASAGDSGSSFRACDGAFGTACFVTGSYGFAAASKVVEMIASDTLAAPKKWTPIR